MIKEFDAIESKLKLIWNDDKLERRVEAENLLSFLKNTTEIGNLRYDQSAFVITVDADYGIGKTFFLKRFVKHAKEEWHAAAYVDAWSDDYQDDPYAAIVSTLQKAFTDENNKNDLLREKAKITWKKAIQAGSILFKGLAWRAGSIAFTGGALEGVESVMQRDEADSKKVESEIQNFTDSSSQELKNINNQTEPLFDRMAAFEESKNAISELKTAIQETVNASEKNLCLLS